MKFRVLQSIFGLVLLVFLSACNDQLIPNFKLISDANTMNTRQVATAIDAKGWKHTLWNECYSPPEKEHCRLVYTRYLVSAPTAPVDYKYYTPSSLDFSYIDPDIAVTDDGAAYGVWRLKNTSTNLYSNCWQNLSIDSTCNVFVSPTSNASVSGAPRIAARGSTVYAVFEEKLPGGPGTQLFFRRLSPLSNFNYAISPSNATAANTSPDLAISPSGTLHVVWDDQEKFLYADNVGNVLGIMSIRWNFTSSTQASRPKIAIDEGIGNEALVYIAYADMLPASDELHIYSFLWSDAQHLPLDSAQVNLTTNLPWNIYGDPAIAAAGNGTSSTVYGAFTATNSSTMGPLFNSSQIFRFSYSKGGANPAATMVTNPTDYQAGKSSPLVTVVHDNTPGSSLLTPVIAWRNETIGPNAFDMYVYNLPNGIRKVFTTSTGTVGYIQGSNTFDLVSNGKQAGGVWIDARSSTDARRTPWVTMNGSQVFIPLVKGPTQTYQNDPR